MELTFGRPAFDRFLSGYFEHFAFQSISTAEALDYIRRELLDRYPSESRSIPLDEWVFQPGLPRSAPHARSGALQAVANGLARAETWKTQQWLEYLQTLKRPVDRRQMDELDGRFYLTTTGNYEILSEWLLLAIESSYEPVYPRLRQFLLTVGRIKFIRPLYSALLRLPNGRERAAALYAEAKPLYHPIAQTAIERLLFLEQKVPGEQRIDP